MFVNRRSCRSLDRVGDPQMQLLTPRQRQAGGERLPDERVRELPARRAPRHRHDQGVGLRFLERRQQRVAGHVADRLEQLQTEPTPDHRTERQHFPAVCADALQTPADDQPNALGDIQILEVEV